MSIPFMRDPYVDRKMGTYQNAPVLDGLVPIFSTTVVFTAEL